MSKKIIIDLSQGSEPYILGSDALFNLFTKTNPSRYASPETAKGVIIKQLETEQEKERIVSVFDAATKYNETRDEKDYERFINLFHGDKEEVEEKEEELTEAIEAKEPVKPKRKRKAK